MTETRSCTSCGAILTDSDEECPNCKLNEVEDAFNQAKESSKAKKDDAAAVYRTLEEYVKELRIRRKKLSSAIRKTSDPNEISKLDKQLASLGNTLAKVSREILNFQKERHALATKMTPEEQMAQILSWFRKQASERQRILLESLIQEYNERRRRKVKPWMKSSESA